MTRIALWFRSLVVGTLAAIAFGLIHDQISVRLSPAYLMDWHPAIVASRDPTVVALAWGVVATWWFGLILGAVLALAATLGGRAVAEWRSVLRAMAGVFVAAALAAAVAFTLFRLSRITLPDSLFGGVYQVLTPDGQRAFSAVAAMHEAAYDVAGAATLVAAGVVWRGRGKGTKVTKLMSSR